MQHWNLEARPARLRGYIVFDFPDRGYPGMYAASSPLLPAFDGVSVAHAEVVGELVDASRLSSEEYDRLLQEVAKRAVCNCSTSTRLMCAIARSFGRFQWAAPSRQHVMRFLLYLDSIFCLTS
jgi:hypothetical protein